MSSRRWTRGERGFTLIEILIVIIVIMIIAALAIPALMRSRMTANETASIAGLKSVVTGQTKSDHREGNSLVGAVASALR